MMLGMLGMRLWVWTYVPKNCFTELRPCEGLGAVGALPEPVQEFLRRDLATCAE